MNEPKLKVTEEVARFAFEVYIDQYLKNGLYIAFANPTAGPWKTVKILDNKGSLVEVHRFGTLDRRPDLVVVEPTARTMVVIEAKATVGNLVPAAQIDKAKIAFEQFQSTIKNSDHPLLAGDYAMIPGFLWHTNNFESELDQILPALVDWPAANQGSAFIGVGDLYTKASFKISFLGSGKMPSVIEKIIS